MHESTATSSVKGSTMATLRKYAKAGYSTAAPFVRMSAGAARKELSASRGMPRRRWLRLWETAHAKVYTRKH
jgi:hypothetical protein